MGGGTLPPCCLCVAAPPCCPACAVFPLLPPQLQLVQAMERPDSALLPVPAGHSPPEHHLAAWPLCLLQVVHQLLQSAADPRRLDFSARNALDLAVLHGHTELCPLLLDAGCWFTNGSGGQGAQLAVRCSQCSV